MTTSSKAFNHSGLGDLMKKILALVSIFLLTLSQANAHSGRTDKNGGHNCSEASKKKGLCTGYHYHSGGGLHLDSTDEIVSTNNENQVNIAILLQSRHTTEDHSDHVHHEKDERIKETRGGVIDHD